MYLRRCNAHLISFVLVLVVAPFGCSGTQQQNDAFDGFLSDGGPSGHDARFIDRSTGADGASADAKVPIPRHTVGWFEYEADCCEPSAAHRIYLKSPRTIQGLTLAFSKTSNDANPPPQLVVTKPWRVVAQKIATAKVIVHLVANTGQQTGLVAELRNVQSPIWSAMRFTADVDGRWRLMNNHAEPVDHDTPVFQNHIPLTIGIFGSAADPSLCLNAPYNCNYPSVSSLAGHAPGLANHVNKNGERAISVASRLEFYSFWPRWERNRDTFVFDAEVDFLKRAQRAGRKIVMSNLWYPPGWLGSEPTTTTLAATINGAYAATSVPSIWFDEAAPFYYPERYYRELKNAMHKQDIGGEIESFVINVPTGYGEIGYPGGAHGGEWYYPYGNQNAQVGPVYPGFPMALYWHDRFAAAAFQKKFGITPAYYEQATRPVADQLNALSWYVESLGHYVQQQAVAARNYFPDAEIIAKIGYADSEQLQQGNDKGLLVQVLKSIPNLRLHAPSDFTTYVIHGTNPAHNINGPISVGGVYHDIVRGFFVQKRVSTLAKHYGIALQFESPTQFTNQRVRIFEDFLNGAQGRYSFSEEVRYGGEFGIPTDKDNLPVNKQQFKYLRGEQVASDIAVYFPTATHWVQSAADVNQVLPSGAPELFRQLLRMGNPDIVDEWAIADPTFPLSTYKVIVMPPTYYMRPQTVAALSAWVAKGGRLLIYDQFLDVPVMYQTDGNPVYAQLFNPPSTTLAGSQKIIGAGATYSMIKDHQQLPEETRLQQIWQLYQQVGGAYQFEGSPKPHGIYSAKTAHTYMVLNFSGAPWQGTVAPFGTAITVSLQSNELYVVDRWKKPSCQKTLQAFSTALTSNKPNVDTNVNEDGQTDILDVVLTMRDEAMRGCNATHVNTWWNGLAK